jgi:hypothetical protein
MYCRGVFEIYIDKKSFFQKTIKKYKNYRIF